MFSIILTEVIYVSCHISNAATKGLSLSMVHEYGPEGSVKVIKVQSKGT